MYLYTVNAFPYGPFKNQIVKEQVYEPDWRSEERTQYTINVADVLADVAPEDISPSIQSAPLGFKPNVTGPEVVNSYTEHVMRVAAHLIKLEERTGRTVTLALEPEPFCFLETTDETVDYFTKHLYSGKSAEMLAKLAKIPISEAHIALRKYRRHGVRHLPPGGGVRGHHRVACRSWSMPGFRSSSCRKPPRCGFRT